MHPFILFIQEINVEGLLCDQHQRRSHDADSVPSGWWRAATQANNCNTVERADGAPASDWEGHGMGNGVQGKVRLGKGAINVH